MYKRVSCPLDPDFAGPSLYAIRDALDALSLEADVVVRWFRETREYGDGLAVAIDTKATKEAILVAEAVSLTVYNSIWWDTIPSEYPDIEKEVKEALEGGKETNDV